MWMISKENRMKIEEALLKLETENISIKYAIEKMGCKKIEKINKNKNYN